jgi:hypothetical protein
MGLFAGPLGSALSWPAVAVALLIPGEDEVVGAGKPGEVLSHLAEESGDGQGFQSGHLGQVNPKGPVQLGGQVSETNRGWLPRTARLRGGSAGVSGSIQDSNPPSCRSISPSHSFVVA